jgi:DNA mismatch endonuclease Vsr
MSQDAFVPPNAATAATSRAPTRHEHDTLKPVPDRLTREERSRLMARVKTRNTAPEVALRSALWTAGLRGWRLHKRVPGRPDLVWQSRRVAVFVDGAFWHGHPDYVE